VLERAPGYPSIKNQMVPSGTLNTRHLKWFILLLVILVFSESARSELVGMNRDVLLISV
jgi:hypothetical protein